MTHVDEIAKWAAGALTIVIGGLVSLVRQGDIQRIKSIEIRQKEQEQAARDARKDVSSEVHELRLEVKAFKEASIRQNAEIIGMLKGTQR